MEKLRLYRVEGLAYCPRANPWGSQSLSQASLLQSVCSYPHTQWRAFLEGLWAGALPRPTGLQTV